MGSLSVITPGEDQRDRIIAIQKEELERAEQKIDALEDELIRARANAQRSIGELRNHLTPLYRALRQVFGDMDAIGPSDDAPFTVATGIPQNDRKLKVWESWKQKLSGKKADFIQALLDHGEMTSAQLKVATHTASSTVPQIIHQLKDLGLIEKNNGKYSLKSL